ncbi:hypothetical protein EJ063_01080 [Vibrio aquaticus]|uniref:Transcription initiation factor TFIIIB n=1 Tax=Vibrio aquaticus TaxID=2496559 RepID=A0A3S0P839_9VIBR|nr:hypothetical protein [Vibrio aquaticus]RTZ17404.1 hypothetical protein EJ063_01080 [Vibrio aquaticus]
MTTDTKQDDVLCCPLCGSEEYLLAASDKMLCAECGSFFEDVSQITPTQPALPHVSVSLQQAAFRALPAH